ncbi:MAG: PQQ-dependent sugar dehydrogenase [Pyrinomonadaceae bacterium]
MKKVRTASLFAVLSLSAGAACAQNPRTPKPASTASTPQACRPVETAEPNAASQQPSFPGQTRVCAVTSEVAFDVTVIAKGLDRPWAVEPLPNGDFLVTEKPGNLRIVSANGVIGQPIGGLLPAAAQGGVSSASSQGGLPPITARGQGGLLDVALSPNFAKDRTIFWSFSEQREGGSGTSVARGRLSEDRRNLENVRIVFRAMPTYDNGLHFGSRLAFGPDGKLYITLGDRFDRPNRPRVQQLDNHLGKIIRIDPDGTAPADNPFAKQAGALPEIWALGHRNIQSAAFDENGRLWTVEHGPRGGDELNLIEKGKNYGWPVQSFGEEYSGEAIPGAATRREGYVDPVYYWDPVIAPSGMQFYTGNAFPAWRGNVFIGGLASKRLVRLVLKDGRVIGEEHLLTDRGRRIRDVRQGPDGALYVVTDERDGELWKITPKR